MKTSEQFVEMVDERVVRMIDLAESLRRDDIQAETEADLWAALELAATIVAAKGLITDEPANPAARQALLDRLKAAGIRAMLQTCDRIIASQ